MSKRKKLYIGKWEEKGWKTINLSFTPSNLLMLLDEATVDEPGEFNHQDIVNWCLKYWKQFLDDDIELIEIEKVAVQIASDVDVQWDLYLANSYSLEQLQNLDFSSINLPREWFKKWATSLRQILDKN